MVTRLDLSDNLVFTLDAEGFFTIASTGNTGNGTNSNTFFYIDENGNTYDREVTAVNNNITADHQGGSLAPTSTFKFPPVVHSPLSLPFPRFPGARKIAS